MSCQLRESICRRGLANKTKQSNPAPRFGGSSVVIVAFVATQFVSFHAVVGCSDGVCKCVFVVIKWDCFDRNLYSASSHYQLIECVSTCVFYSR